MCLAQGRFDSLTSCVDGAVLRLTQGPIDRTLTVNSLVCRAKDIAVLRHAED